jgi:hypothetical protein
LIVGQKPDLVMKHEFEEKSNEKQLHAKFGTRQMQLPTE